MRVPGTLKIFLEKNHKAYVIDRRIHESFHKILSDLGGFGVDRNDQVDSFLDQD